jgi:cysteine dioxygenase
MQHTAMTLQQFFTSLDELGDRIPLDSLTALLGELHITVDDVRDYVVFSPDGYQRNLVQRGPGYEALLLCWKNGQRSAIHDHRGSACGVMVVQGTATETVFERNQRGWIYPVGSNECEQGAVCGSNDMDTHQISNLQADGQDLITLHVYSPPLGRVGNYSLKDNTVEDVLSPINRRSVP